MTSEAKNVSEYLANVPENRLEALVKLRGLCIDILTGYEESMSYKMPSYKKNNIVEVAFASQKQHVCIYILKHEVMLSNQDLLKGINHGKGCIRYSNPEKIDYGLIKKLLEETIGSDHQIC